MATDEELAQLAEAAVNPQSMQEPAPSPAAPVIGTPEGPGIPPVAPIPPPVASPPTQPAMPPPVAPAAPVDAGALPAPVTIPNAGIDTRALDIARQSGTGLAQAQAAVGPAKVEAANAEAAGLDDTASMKRDQAVEISAEQQAQKDGLTRAQQIADQAHEEVKNFKPRDFWGDMTRGEAIRTNIAYALGVFASSGKRGNGINPVAERIKSIIETQYRQDRDKLSSLENFAKYKDSGVTNLREQYNDDIAKLKLKQALALGAVADEAKAYLLRANKPVEEAENNVLVKKFEQERDKAYADGFEKLKHDKAMESLERARLAAANASLPDSPAIQAAVAAFIAKNRNADPGETQAGAIDLAAKLGSRNPTATVGKLLTEPDKQEAARNKAIGKIGNEQAALRRERVSANIHEFNTNADKLKPGVITPEVLEKVQRNEAEMHATEQPHSLLDAAGNNIGRRLGMVAKSPYDGLTREQTEVMRALDATLQHGAEMQPTTGAEVSQKWKETYRPRPGMDQSSIDNSIKSIKEMGKTFRAIIDPRNIGGRADVPAGAAAPASKFKPGSKVTYKGKSYRVADDGDTLEPL